MSKEQIPDNFLISTIKWILKGGLRLIVILAIIFVLVMAGAFIVKKYNDWNDILVILVALKCGPSTVRDEKTSQTLFASLKGTRRHKKISKLSGVLPMTYIKDKRYSIWKESYGFEYPLDDLTTTRDEYFFTKTDDNGDKHRISYNRKTLQRKYVSHEDDIKSESTRECSKITIEEYNSELESVRKAFLEGNKI